MSQPTPTHLELLEVRLAASGGVVGHEEHLLALCAAQPMMRGPLCQYAELCSRVAAAQRVTGEQVGLPTHRWGDDQAMHQVVCEKPSLPILSALHCMAWPRTWYRSKSSTSAAPGISVLPFHSVPSWNQGTAATL